MRGTGKVERGRGFGPFTGRQLTTIIIAFMALVMIPTAAFAASGAFTSATVAPALTAKNTSAAAGAVGFVGSNTAAGANVRFGAKGTASGTGGVGVQGVGTRYGVQSVGPFSATGPALFGGSVTVADGKPLLCAGCVGAAALSTAASQVQPVLGHGQTQSGVFAVADGSSTSGYMATGVTFSRPVPGALTMVYMPNGTPSSLHCPSAGSADPGYVCLYSNNGGGGVTSVGGTPYGTPAAFGFQYFWAVNGPGEYIGGIYSVTAP